MYSRSDKWLFWCCVVYLVLGLSNLYFKVIDGDFLVMIFLFVLSLALWFPPIKRWVYK